MFSLRETRKLMFLGGLAIVALIGIFLVTRSRGKWICEDGIWVAKGRPASEQPLRPCTLE